MQDKSYSTTPICHSYLKVPVDAYVDPAPYLPPDVRKETRFAAGHIAHVFQGLCSRRRATLFLESSKPHMALLAWMVSWAYCKLIPGTHWFQEVERKWVGEMQC